MNVGEGIECCRMENGVATKTVIPPLEHSRDDKGEGSKQEEEERQLSDAHTTQPGFRAGSSLGHRMAASFHTFNEPCTIISWIHNSLCLDEWKE